MRVREINNQTQSVASALQDNTSDEFAKSSWAGQNPKSIILCSYFLQHIDAISFFLYSSLNVHNGVITVIRVEVSVVTETFVSSIIQRQNNQP